MVTLLYALAFAASLFVVIASGITLAKVFRLRLVPPQAMRLSPVRIPADVRTLLAPGLKHLLALGFVRPAALRQVSQRIGGRPVPEHALVLIHDRLPAAAYLIQLPAPDRTRHYAIFFVSRTTDGHTLLTRNRASTIGLPARRDLTLQDLWLPNWRALWRAHRRRMRLLEPDVKRWERLSARRWIDLGAEFEAAMFRARALRGTLVHAEDGSFRFSLRAALAILLRAWAVLVPSSRPMDEDKAAPPFPPAAPGAPAAAAVALKVNTYEQESHEQPSTRGSVASVWLLFLATAVVAGASFGLSMDAGLVIALLAVLLVHEAGHMLAMRWAGYRDLRIFFLPFLGAAASGRHAQPTTVQELVVLFAGPVPGLLLGLAALIWAPVDPLFAGWWRDWAVLAVALNAFNLLPIHPLDGGRIFEILLLSRWPWLAFAARVAGLGVLAVAALGIDDLLSRSALLGAILVLSLGFGHQFRIARLRTALHAAGKWGGLARRDALEALFAAIGGLGYTASPWPTQKQLVDELLPQAMRPRLRPMARAGGLATYGLLLALPLLAWLFYAWGLAAATSAKSDESHQAALQPDAALLARFAAQRNADLEAQRARIAAAPDPARRWEMLAAEIDALADEPIDDLPAAKALLDDAAALAPTLPDPLAKQATVAIWKAGVSQETAARLDHLRSALALYDAAEGGPADPGPLMLATAMWLQEGPPEDRSIRATLIDKALSLGNGHTGLGGAETVRTYKLDDLLNQGNPQLASGLSRGWFESALQQGDGLALVSAAQSCVDLALGTEGPGPALDLLDRLLAQIESQPTQPAAYTVSLRRHGMWLAEAAGRREWQQAQAPRLSAENPMGAEPSLLASAMFWVMSGGHGPGATLNDVDLAHWRGDGEEARHAAQRLLEQRPDFAVPLWPVPETLPKPETYRLKMLRDTRKAVYERYGLPVKLAP